MINKKDWFFLIVSPVLFSVISIITKANFFTLIILFFGTMAAYFSLKRKTDIVKVTIFSLCLLPFMMVIDYLTSVNGAWSVAPSIVSYKFLGLSSVENILWGFLRIYSVVMLYIWYLNGKSEKLSKKIKYLIAISLGIYLIFMTVLNLNPALLQVKNIYFIVGVIFGIIPFGIFVIKYPRIIKRFIFPTLYFFYYCIFFEFTGLFLKCWAFTGTDYLATIRVFNLTLPIEEVIWLMFGSAIVLSYFVFFALEKD